MNKKVNLWSQREQFAYKILLATLVFSLFLSFFIGDKKSIEGFLSYISLGFLNASFIVFIIFKAMNLIQNKETNLKPLLSISVDVAMAAFLLYTFWFRLTPWKKFYIINQVTA